MMNRSGIKIAIAVGVGVIALVLFLKWKQASDLACPGPTEKFKVEDPYMNGVVEQGSKVSVILRYYKCRPLERNDIVTYNRGAGLPPTTRFARAIPGDQFEIVKDSAHRAWNIKINGQLLVNNGKPQFFGGDTPPTLSLYEKSHNGRLAPGEFIAFSNTSPGDFDSSVYGLYSVNDIIGKVETK